MILFSNMVFRLSYNGKTGTPFNFETRKKFEGPKKRIEMFYKILFWSKKCYKRESFSILLIMEIFTKWRFDEVSYVIYQKNCVKLKLSWLKLTKICGSDFRTKIYFTWKWSIALLYLKQYRISRKANKILINIYIPNVYLKFLGFKIISFKW